MATKGSSRYSDLQPNSTAISKMKGIRNQRIGRRTKEEDNGWCRVCRKDIDLADPEAWIVSVVQNKDIGLAYQVHRMALLCSRACVSEWFTKTDAALRPLEHPRAGDNVKREVQRQKHEAPVDHEAAQRIGRIRQYSSFLRS